MPEELRWIYEGMGGGPGAVGWTLLALVTVMYWRDLKGQVKEHKDSNKDLRAAINRIADTIEAWTPEQQQQRRLKRPG